ncbi:hypothetical protein V2J09_020405 [Rumex salicifolius]
MMLNYQDAMAICKHHGYPDLFVTFQNGMKLQGLSKKGVYIRRIDLTLFAEVQRKQIIRQVIYTIEFQKRGLPHAYIMLFLDKDSKLPTTLDIDKVISTEISNPTDDPALYVAVTDYMMHGPSGPSNNSSPCMADRKCKKHDNGITVEKNGVPLDNGYVVPYNAKLLLKFRAHINVESCNRSVSIKYLFKYSSVQRLSFHLSDEHNIYFDDDDPIDEVLDNVNAQRSIFRRNSFGWRIPKLRKFERKVLLLAGFITHHRVVAREVCYALGLLDDDKEYIYGITEASFWGSAYYVRSLFVFLLISACMSDLILFGNKKIIYCSSQVIYNLTVDLSDVQLQNYALVEIEKLLQRNGSSLRNFNTMPTIDQSLLSEGVNKLILEELRYDKASLAGEHRQLISSFAHEQKGVYDEIMNVVLSNNGGVFFIWIWRHREIFYMESTFHGY